jgi:hypothetical protein
MLFTYSPVQLSKAIHRKPVLGAQVMLLGSIAFMMATFYMVRRRLGKIFPVFSIFFSEKWWFCVVFQVFFRETMVFL